MSALLKSYYQNEEVDLQWHANRVSFSEYLKGAEWFSEYFIHPKGQVTVHWADHFEWHGQVDLHPVMELPRKVWVYFGSRLVETTMREIYDLYYAKKIDISAIKLSFIGPQGPYKTLPVSEVITMRDYRMYLYSKLLKKSADARSFRLKCSSSFLCHGEQNDQTVMDLIQLVGEGALFRYSSHFLDQVWGTESELFFSFNEGPLKIGHITKLEDLYQHLSQFPGSLLFTPIRNTNLRIDTKKCARSKSTLDDKDIVFVPYSAMSTTWLADFYATTRRLIEQDHGQS